MRWLTRHTETHTNLWYTTAPTAPHPPAPSTSSSRPSSRADRKLRFADLTPSSIHVYESAPSSPRKTALALPPPDPSDPSTISLGQFSGQAATNARKQDLNPQPKAGMSTSLEPETEEDSTVHSLSLLPELHRRTMLYRLITLSLLVFSFYRPRYAILRTIENTFGPTSDMYYGRFKYHLIKSCGRYWGIPLAMIRAYLGALLKEPRLIDKTVEWM